MTQSPTPLISIGMPTFNRAGGYLQQALDCALAQSYEHFEIVVCDNCSEDNTTEVVASYADPRIRYVRHAVNIGANNNFNHCLKEARGEYFLLFHDDDRIDADFLAACVAVIDPARPPTTVRTGSRIIDGQGATLYESPNRSNAVDLPALLLDWSAGRLTPYLCSTLFHTEGLRTVGGFNSPRNLLQDVVAGFRLNARGPWADVQAPKASFRHHDGEITSSARIEHWCEDSLFLLELTDELTADDPGARQSSREFIVRMAYQRCEAVASIAARLRAYAHVNETLGGTRHPLGILAARVQRRVLGKLGARNRAQAA